MVVVLVVAIVVAVAAVVVTVAAVVAAATVVQYCPIAASLDTAFSFAHTACSVLLTSTAFSAYKHSTTHFYNVTATAVFPFRFSTAVSVKLHSSFSPCKDCCSLLQHFTTQRPQCEVQIIFTCVYLANKGENNDALRKLNDLRNVRLIDIFTAREWRLLQNAGFLFLSPEELECMKAWDCYWREKLKKIINIAPRTYFAPWTVICHYSIIT